MNLPEDPSDRLIDSLLRELARKRIRDEALVASIHAALAASRQEPRAQQSPFRSGLLLSAAAVLVAALGFICYQWGSTASRHGREAPLVVAKSPPAHPPAARLRIPAPASPDLAAPAPEGFPGESLSQKKPGDRDVASNESFKQEAPPTRSVSGDSLSKAASPRSTEGPVRFLAWDNEVVGMKISLVRPVGAEPIRDLHSLKRSRPFDVSGELVKLRAEGKTNPDGSTADLELSLNGYTRPLVIILRNDKVPSGLAGVVIDDSGENFRWGSYMVFNATKEELAIMVDRQVTRLPVGWTPTKITPKNVVGPSAIEIRPVKDTQKVLYSMVWQGTEDIRRLIIVIPSHDKRVGEVIPKVIPQDRKDGL